MTQKTGKKIGFFAALTMLVGSIVGIGIFFKNGSIFGATGDGTTALMAWIIGGLVSLFAAISFSEIGSTKTKNVHGLAAWAEIYGGKKLGYFTRFNYSFFYFGILMVAFGIFVSEAFFQFLLITGAISDQPAIWVHALIGIALLAGTLFLNFISVKASGWVQIVTTIIKFIPLLTVLVVGIVLPNTHHVSQTNGFTDPHFNISGLVAALPAVLFAYDAFLNVGTLSGKTEGGSKTTAKVVIIGLIATVTLYSLIAVSSILHGAGSVETVLRDSIGNHDWIGIVVWMFIAISSYGVLNGLSAAGLATFEQSVATNTIFGSKTLKAKFGDKKALLIIMASILTFWACVIYIPSIVTNSDQLVDGITNFPTLFFFAIYATVILLYTLKRDKAETDKINNILFKIASWFAVVTIFLIIGWQFFGTQTLDVFTSPNANISWGFFATHGTAPWTRIEGFGVFITCLTLFVGLPFLNSFLSNKFEENNVIVNTQELSISN